MTGTTVSACDDCTDEYGPCDAHGDTLVSREGAAVRTADESLVTFVLDAVSLGAELSPWGRTTLDAARAMLAATESHGVAWFTADEDGAALQDDMVTLSDQCETELATLGLSVFREDGYRIVRVTGGPLADD